MSWEPHPRDIIAACTDCMHVTASMRASHVGSKCCGAADACVGAWGMQVGVYDELSFQRLDLILSEAGKNGVYVILPLVNQWPDLGGMQWYVDQVRRSSV